MIDTKIYHILTQFSITSLNRFEKFVHSKYFNSNLNLISLFLQYKLHIQNPNEPISKEAIWQVVLGNISYDDIKFRRLNSDLMKLFERFLTIEEFEKSPLHGSEMLLSAIKNKKNSKLINNAIQNAELNLQRFINRSSEYYLHQYQIESSLFYLNQSDINVQSKTNIERIAENLDKFYIAEKLKYYCDILLRENSSTISYNFNFIEEILNFISHKDLEDNLIIHIYFLIYQTLVNPDNEKTYQELKNVLFQNKYHFNGLQTQELFGSLLNFASKQRNKGNNAYEHEIIEIYSYLMGQDIFITENYMTPYKFNNAITTALRTGNYDFAEDFIEMYKHLIPDSHQSSIVTFSLAQVYFYKEEYQKVLTELQQSDYPDIITNLRAKSLLIAAFYELHEFESVLLQSDSFKVYLSRKKKDFPSDRIQTYLNYISVIRGLSQCEKGDASGVQKIEKEIKRNTGKLVNESWLKEKLDAKR